MNAVASRPSIQAQMAVQRWAASSVWMGLRYDWNVAVISEVSATRAGAPLKTASNLSFVKCRWGRSPMRPGITGAVWEQTGVIAIVAKRAELSGKHGVHEVEVPCRKAVNDTTGQRAGDARTPRWPLQEQISRERGVPSIQGTVNEGAANTNNLLNDI